MSSEVVVNSFFDTHPIFIYSFEDLKIIDANNAACKRYGYNSAEFRSMKFTDLDARLNDEEKDIIDQVDPENNGNRYIHKTSSGERFEVYLTSHNIEFMGKPARMVVVKETDDTRNINSKDLSFYTDNILPFAEIDWEAFNSIIRWDRDAERLFGWTEEEVKKHPDFTSVFISEEVRLKLEKRFREAEDKKEQNFKHINKNYTKNGKEILCEWYNSLIYDHEGKLSYVYSMVHDVTEVYDNIDRLKGMRDNYRNLFNSIADAVYIQDLNGKILEINVATQRMFGYKRSEITGEHYSKLAAPGKFDDESFAKLIQKAKQGTSQQMKVWGKRKNGEVFPKHIHMSIANYFGEEVLIVIAKDLSEEHSAKEALKKRNELFIQLFENTPIGIVFLNKHNEIEMVNAGFEELFGYTFDEIKGLELDKVIVADDRREEARRLSESRESFVKESRRVRKDGSVRDVVIYGVPVTLEGKTLAIFGMYIDITEQKKAEKNIQKSLREKEILLAEIHHRVKNNLAVITGLLELQSYSTESETARAALSDSQRRVTSIALIHEKLYQSENFSEIRFDQYLEELIDVIKKSIGHESNEVDITIDADPVKLTLTQAIPCGLILNETVTNAYKHAFETEKSPKIDITFKENGKMLLFRVADNGSGFPDGMTEKMGESLGLKLIETLSKQLNGDINFWNEDGGIVEIKFEKLNKE